MLENHVERLRLKVAQRGHEKVPVSLEVAYGLPRLATALVWPTSVAQTEGSNTRGRESLADDTPAQLFLTPWTLLSKPGQGCGQHYRGEKP